MLPNLLQSLKPQNLIMCKSKVQLIVALGSYSVLRHVTSQSKKVFQLQGKTKLFIYCTLNMYIQNLKSPGQTETQVDASCQLASTYDFVRLGLVYTCTDLRSLWSRSKLICAQVDTSFSPFGYRHKSTQVSASLKTCIYMQLHLARALYYPLLCLGIHKMINNLTACMSDWTKFDTCIICSFIIVWQSEVEL